MNHSSRWLFFLAVAVSLVFVPSGGFAQFEVNDSGDFIQSAENGNINWTARKIEAKGVAAKDQSEFKQQVAAEAIARTNLLKVLKSVQINSQVMVRDGILGGMISLEKIEGLLSHSRVTAPSLNQRGLMEVTAYVYLDRQGNTVLIPDALIETVSASDEPTPWPTEETVPGACTGLIIDAGHLPVRPVLMPQIYIGDTDQSIFTANVSREYLLTHGLCGYAGSMEKAMKTTDRIGTNPLVIKAVGVKGGGADIAISEEDAIKILGIDKSDGILSQCRVMIVAR